MKKNIFIIPTDTCYGIACSIDDVKSYEKIYKIKKRSFDKPLAIMVEDFHWLDENTYLTENQIDFLKNYPHPFTILCACPAIQALLDFEDDNNFYKNKDVYKNIAFRVAHNKDQRNLIKKIGPIFLTSANKSGQNELYNYKDLEETFNEYEHIIDFLGKQDLDPLSKSSDIFSFIGDSIEIQYIRKNS